jgi:hypothetical protein
MISSCVNIANKDGTSYENGYYVEKINYDFEKVYKATIDAIKSGQTYDSSGNPYQLKVNKKIKDSAMIEAASDSDPSDFLEILIKKVSKDSSVISIKYGKEGDSIRSSALIGIIKGNIVYS